MHPSPAHPLTTQVAAGCTGGLKADVTQQSRAANLVIYCETVLTQQILGKNIPQKFSELPATYRSGYRRVERLEGWGVWNKVWALPIAGGHSSRPSCQTVPVAPDSYEDSALFAPAHTTTRQNPKYGYQNLGRASTGGVVCVGDTR